MDPVSPIDPLDARAHAREGLAAAQRDDWARAIAHLRVAVATAPETAEGWMHLASALRHVGHLDAAERLANQAIAMNPTLAGAFSTLGLCALDRGRPEDATAHFTRAMDIEPGNAAWRMNLGIAAHAMGRRDEAFGHLDRALEIDPRLAAAHYNLGALHHELGGHDKAARHYREAIALRPSDEGSHFNLALTHFIGGRFEQAWKEYAWRPQRREHAPILRREGRTRIAIQAEQGLGDLLFFLRFAPVLRASGITLDFAGEARLHAMLARTGLFTAVAQRLDELPEADRDVVLAGDLATILPGLAATTPPPLMLVPDPQRLGKARNLAKTLGSPPYVAVAWRSGEPRSGRIENLFKQVPLDALGAALRGHRATYVAVQRDPAPAEIDTLSRAIGYPVHDMSVVNADLEDALALLAVVDEYVGVSSTLVHLRAGVGGTARILAPFPHEWRWMESGDASPWFPNARVYRQAPGGDWSAALANLTRDLTSR